MKMLYFGRRSIGRRHSPVVSCIIAIALLAGGLIALPQSLSSAVAQESKAKTDSKTEAKKGEVKKGGDDAQKKPRRRRGRRGPATVLVDTVKQGISVETVTVYGRVISGQTGVIASLTRGAVKTIHARVGDRVKKGDVLVTLSSDMLNSERALKAAELKEFSAKIRTAGAQLGLAAQELERLERLRRSAAFSVARYQDKLRDVERVKSSIAEARAKADQARAELHMADLNLSYAQIRAPYNGVVSARHVEVGNYLNVGANVVTLLNDSSLEIEAEVPANRIGGLTPDAKIKVVSEHGKPYRAKVRAVVPEENALSRTRLVRFTPIFKTRDATVAANQSVIVHIPSGAARNAVTVHKDAITQRRGKRVVFIVRVKKDENGKEITSVGIRGVELGDAFGERFEVLSGLKPGDRVVVRGNERLRPNQKIRIQSAKGERKGRRGRGKQGGAGDGKPSSESQINRGERKTRSDG
ncbi:MAG: RND family efflux transporter MFP subunit [Alphaproteobacteria bacterium]|jgi:RND family efflux transporter MFP subunit